MTNRQMLRRKQQRFETALAATAMAFSAVVLLVLMVASIDALEYETTGECKDCLILNFSE